MARHRVSLGSHYAYTRKLLTCPSCSRGIGLEVVKQLASDPSREVFATCRDPDSASVLKSVPKLHVLKLDVDNEASIRNAAEVVSGILGDRGLDYLINNAAIVSPIDQFQLHFLAHPPSFPSDQNPVWDHPFTATLADLQAAFTSNLAGPFIISQVFLPLIEKSERKVLAHIGTGLASFAQHDAGTWNDTPVSYSITKAGLNMLVRLS